MSKLSKRAKIIISLGISVAIMPLLGFPGSIESGLVIILGLSIAGSMYWAEKRIAHCDDCIASPAREKKKSDREKPKQNAPMAGERYPDSQNQGGDGGTVVEAPLSDMKEESANEEDHEATKLHVQG